MKLLIVAGARPNFMKVAPIVSALRRRQKEQPDLLMILVHTGQHYDQHMSGGFFQELNIPEPDINLQVGSGSHAQQTGRVMMAFEESCLAELPDWVIVVGDVNSTMACAITAKKLGIRVAHVEAGLRSRDMSMPEEINRLCTDAISDVLFTTEPGAMANLRDEGVPSSRIHFTGNTMIDTLLQHLEQALNKPLPPGLVRRDYAVLTLHRPSNVDSVEALRPLFLALNEIAERLPIVFPAHPRTTITLRDLQLNPNIRVIGPCSYLTFIGLMANARMVLTDSGGVQEETTALGVPCITLRNNTERPITCEVGTNILAGTDPTTIRNIAFEVLNSGYSKGRIPDKWDGNAAERIVDILLNAHSLSG